tara:strand:- start:1868 stop:2242 length:375 start_codon:yes stop_codon:yes gene_type:complete
MKGYKFVVTDMSIRSNAIDVISSLEVGAKTIWEVIVQPKKKSRTETQNRTYWRWVGEISLETGYDKSELHSIFGKKFLPMVEIKIGSSVELIPISTTKLSSPDFSNYLLQIESFCATEIGHRLS